MKQQIKKLDGKWKLTFFEQTSKKPIELSELKAYPTIDCAVPGNVELDLAAAGYLPEDLFMGENLALAEKYETYEWWYHTDFEAEIPTDGSRLILRFEAVDCFAEYYINGNLIGSSENMFIPTEFDVTDDAVSGSNSLYVRIRSAVLEENDIPATLFSINANWQKYSNSSSIRKAAHSYSWDIMPRAVSAGIWRGVSLVTRPACRFNQLYLYTDSVSADKKSAKLRFAYELALPYDMYKKHMEIKVKGICKGSVFEKSFNVPFKSGNERIEIENPELWWPKGYGEANIYDTKAVLYADGAPVAESDFKFGIRTTVLERTNVTDGKSGSFRFIINGEEIMAKGSNWVPMDAFHSRDAERYAKALKLADDIGCNILRCWGGNVYEDDAFFDFCDKAGIMVWQDFAMACYTYPRTDEFCALMKKEATAIVRKLRQHPSLIVWSGDNECDMSLAEGFNQNSFNPNRVNKVTRSVIPDAIIDNDCGRPYLPSSPFVSDDVYEAKDFKLLPEDHLWGPRDYYKSDFYKHSNAHFVSETGYHGCPSVNSVKKFMTPSSLWSYNNSEWLFHSSDQRGNPTKIDRIELMQKQIKQLFGIEAKSLEEFSELSQFSQAEAKKYFIERVRMHRPEKSGVIWWNLIDGWPQFSDAVVDYFYEKKTAYNYIKASQQPFCIFCDEIKDEKQQIIAANDTLEEMNGHYTAYDGESGEMIADGDFNVPKNQCKTLSEFNCFYSTKRLIIIKWEANGKKGANHFINGMLPFDAEKYKKWYEIIKREVFNA